jgi:ribonuclease HI
MEYAEFVASVRNQIRLEFVHVKAHTGIPGNEEAD